MPQPIAEIEGAPPIIPRQHVAVLIEIRNVAHFDGEPALIEPRHVVCLVEFDPAEAFGEGDLLFIRQRLIVKHQHGVPIHSRMDHRHRGRIERHAQIDAFNLGGEFMSDRGEPHGHLPVSSPSPTRRGSGWGPFHGTDSRCALPPCRPPASGGGMTQCASGSGRSWKCTTSGLDSVSGVLPGAPGAGASMPSMCIGVRLPEVTHSPRPFQPALGSSMRPSRPLAKKPIGYDTRSSITRPLTSAWSESD